MAADVLRPVYRRQRWANGFVSLEVSPSSAHDTEATVAEAQHLWQVVARPNVMIKVPATHEGIPAVEALTAEGVNVNITLMFSLDHYEAVAQAYLRGLDRHPDPRQVASVASVFVSRLDTVTDRLLEQIGSPEALRYAERLPSRTPDASIVGSGRFSTARDSRRSNGAARVSNGRFGPAPEPRILPTPMSCTLNR